MKSQISMEENSWIKSPLGLALMFTYLAFAGFIRREADVPAQFSCALSWPLFFALAVGFGQIVFAYNLFKTLKRKASQEEVQSLKT
ncbi:MAG: hypothetical protein WAZ77_10580 [Candidatus Nitrosopolaris sp.]|jgi:hypothetical protein